MAEFDRHADSYKEQVDSSIAFSGAESDLFVGIKARLVAELAGRLLGDPAELRALDVGCGVGATDRFLEGRFASLHGVDTSAASVEAARERNPWAEYAAYAEGEPLPYGGDHFDLAFAICVVHHVPVAGWEGFAGEMARVVRPGGVIAVFEHNPYNPLTRVAVNSCEFDAEAVLLSRRRAAGLLRGAGLEPVESPYIVFFPRQGRRLRAIERRLGWLPLGAQYYVAARRP